MRCPSTSTSVYFDGNECTAAVVIPPPPPFTELDAGTNPCMPGKFCRRSVAEVNPVFAISSEVNKVTGKEDESSRCAMLEPVTTISCISVEGASVTVSAAIAVAQITEAPSPAAIQWTHRRTRQRQDHSAPNRLFPRDVTMMNSLNVFCSDLLRGLSPAYRRGISAHFPCSRTHP